MTVKKRITGFNTQPPEGGCTSFMTVKKRITGFNTQPPEGGCQSDMVFPPLKLSGFNTQPPEGGCVNVYRGQKQVYDVSTHSRPKAAAGLFF